MDTAPRAVRLSRLNCASAWTNRYDSSNRPPLHPNPRYRSHIHRAPPLTIYSTIQKPQEKKKNTVNYHLMRMYPKVVGPRKKDGVLG